MRLPTDRHVRCPFPRWTSARSCGSSRAILINRAMVAKERLRLVVAGEESLESGDRLAAVVSCLAQFFLGAVSAWRNLYGRLVFGGCLCGATRYELAAEPMMSAHCYCRDCQRSSGGAMASILVVPKAAFRLIKGEPKFYAVRPIVGTKSPVDSPRIVGRDWCRVWLVCRTL